MTELSSPNRSTLQGMAEEVRPLLGSLTFVGGQVVELLITDPAAIRIRPTKDVDVVVPVTTKLEYRRAGDQLRDLGFKNDMGEDAPIGRWISPHGRKLDLMPVDSSVLGFSNEWYRRAVESAVLYELQPDLHIRIPRAPVLLATKLVAFRNRGGGDLLGSHDMEDIITLVAGRPELTDEVLAESNELRRWVSDELSRLIDDPDFRYAVEGALPDAREISGLNDVVIDSFSDLVLPR